MNILTVDGMRKPITEWAEDFGIPVSLIRSRLKRGWGEERAVTEPMVVRRGEKLSDDALLDAPAKPKVEAVILIEPWLLRPWTIVPEVRTRRPRGRRPAKLVTYQGVSLSCRDWADRLGISRQSMHHRLKTKPLEEAFKPPRTGRAV